MKKGRPPQNQAEEDKALWQRVTATVRPYAKPPEKKAQKPPPAPLNRPPALPVRAASAAARPPSAPPLPAFDRGWGDKLARGGTRPEGRLDLHGMTQTEAYAALGRFVRAQQKAGRRTVLVITGKGRAGGGVLRRLLPLWLEEEPLRGAVVAFTPARPKDGGEGAFYVRLRKPKK